MKYKLQKRDIDQLQGQSKKKTSETNAPPTIEVKNKLKNTEQIDIEIDLTLTIKKQGQLKQKAQAPIGQAGRVHL